MMMRRRQRLADLPVRMEQREISVDGRTVTYGVLVPKSAPPDNGYPLILALHYSTGQDPGLSPYYGLGYAGLLVLPALQDLNAIIVAPDAPEATWSHPSTEKAVLAMLVQVRKDFRVDDRKTLVTGFSMGGYGAWFFAANHPTLFRAAIPMGSMPLVTRAETTKAVQAAVNSLEPDDAWTAALKTVPLYVIHSRQDTLVPFAAAERVARLLEQRGANIRFVAVDDLAHHETSGYVEPLKAAMPWIREVWAR